MRRMCFAVAAIAAIAAAYGLGRRQLHSQIASNMGRRVLYYVDPMHPAYRSDKPGVAPDCGMQLEPVFAESANNLPPSSSPTQLSAGAVRIDGATQRSVGIHLAQVEKNVVTRTIRVVGRVVPEDTRTYRINSGVDGFIRETYNDSVGMLVKKNQKLATYYAPDFLSVASGFLTAVQGLPGSVHKDGARTVPFPGALAKQGVSSPEGYADRLRNLGMSDEQIERMANDHQLPETIDVVAPANGFILARNISPGQHFTRDIEFYRVADLSQVWVVAEVSAQEAPYLRPEGPAKVILKDEGRELSARITDSLPQSETGGGTIKLRLEVNNPKFILRPEMLADVELPVRLPSAVTVPLDAVVDSGGHARVYVENGEGIFEPREVETGWRSSEQVEILHGVQPGERIVVAATFLVDSESRLKTPASSAALAAEKPAAMPEPMASSRTVKDPSCGMPVDPAKAATAGNTLAYHGATYYFCSSKCKQAFRDDPTRSEGKRLGGDGD